ncbi:hypothetical protein PFISCL1PPCAC_19905, partial [Pristionchus fissidentatus]
SIIVHRLTRQSVRAEYPSSQSCIPWIIQIIHSLDGQFIFIVLACRIPSPIDDPMLLPLTVKPTDRVSIVFPVPEGRSYDADIPNDATRIAIIN